MSQLKKHYYDKIKYFTLRKRRKYIVITFVLVKVQHLKLN